MEQGTKGGAACARSYDVGQGEYADWGEPQHPSDHHQHHFGKCPEEAGQAFARLHRQARERKGEHRGENDQGQHRVVDRRCEGIGGDYCEQELGKVRHFSDRL